MPQADDQEKNYITPAGFRTLQAEFEQLRNHKRREVVAKLAEAAAEGDRSENAEYIYRKRQLREIDRRIRFLARRMAIAEVIDPSQHRSDRVCFGAVVTVEDQDGEQTRYQVVGVDETDPKQGRISWRSPIGKALIGKRVNETVVVRWHAGERELTIVGIEFPRMSEAPLQPLPPFALSEAMQLGEDDGDEPQAQ
ncbi:MAG: transcription elongation factor GreB [Myxococcales bacterium]|nr:transcription elongation factor GreB [Myxococcota bacterium]MDW8282307.1 transcription elongation factor GreB [Myxococcales bacterium]